MRNKQLRKSEATRNKLVECAKELFYEKGFDRTAVREIVKAAGVAQGTFYLYFETKEEILYHIAFGVLEKLNTYIEILNVENPEIEDINHLVDGLVLYMEQNPNLINLLHNTDILELVKLKGMDPSTSPEWFLISAVEKWLENAEKKGLIAPKTPKLYSRIIFQIAHELLENAFLYNYPDTPKVVAEEVKQIIKKILM